MRRAGLCSLSVDVGGDVTCHPHQLDVVVCRQAQHEINRADHVASNAAMA
jgi:hypothetical protein